MAIADVQLLVNYNIQPANWEKSRVISNLDVKVAVSSDDVNMTSHSQMTDDNIEGAYAQAAAGAEYILYDLGQIFPITELRAIYRGESAAFSIFGSADGNTYDLIYTAITTGAYYSPDDTGSIYLDRPEYRYIKFVRPNQDKLIGIRELYLYTILPTKNIGRNCMRMSAGLMRQLVRQFQNTLPVQRGIRYLQILPMAIRLHIAQQVHAITLHLIQAAVTNQAALIFNTIIAAA